MTCFRNRTAKTFTPLPRKGNHGISGAEYSSFHPYRHFSRPAKFQYLHVYKSIKTMARCQQGKEHAKVCGKKGYGEKCKVKQQAGVHGHCWGLLWD